MRLPIPGRLPLAIALALTIPPHGTGHARPGSTQPTLEPLLAKAAPLCDRLAAPAMAPLGAVIVGPAVVLFRDAADKPWQLGHQVSPDAAAADVRVVLCVSERLVDSGRTYTDGAKAFDRVWTVVAGKMDGALIASRVLTGVAPLTKSGFGPGIGAPPLEKLVAVLDPPAIRRKWALPKFNAIALSPDARTAALVQEGRTEVWSLERAAALHSLPFSKNRNTRCTGVAFSRDGALLATAAPGGGDKGLTCSAIEIWSLAGGKRQQSIDPKVERNIVDLTFAPDGRSIVAAGAEITVWDVQTGRLARTLPVPGRTWGVAMSADARMLAWTGTSAGALLFRLDRDEAPVTVADHAYRAAFSPDGALLAIASGAGIGNSGALVLWDVARQAAVGAIKREREATSAAFSPDGRLVAFGEHARVSLWEASTARRVAEVPLNEGAGGVAFTPDGGTLLVASSPYALDRDLRSYDVAELMKTAPAPSAAALGAAVAEPSSRARARR